jgi:hypothetical protein
MATEATEKKSDKDKLAKGAAEIKKAAAKAQKLEPLVIPESKRPMKDILEQRVTVLDGSIGLKIAEDTPIEEVLRISDWTRSMSDHVGFMIGDVLCFGDAKWGKKYAQAMEQTGRAYFTLAHYKMTAQRIPPEKRVAALSFTHHREILAVRDDEKIAKMLTDVSSDLKKGKTISTMALREKIVNLKPKKAPKRATSGKGKKGKAKPVAPPYKPTEAEENKLEEAWIATEEASKLVSKLYSLVGRLSNKDKKRWLNLTEPFVTFYNGIDRITGTYGD